MSRALTGRRRIASATAALALALAAVVLVAITSEPAGDAAPARDWRVDRATRGFAPSLGGADVLAFDGAARRVEASEARRAANVEGPSAEDPVTIRLRPRLPDGTVPERVAGLLSTAGAESNTWFDSARPDEDGVVTFVETIRRERDAARGLVLATSEATLSAALDERLLYEEASGFAVTVALPPLGEDGVIDAGEVVLEPPVHVGTLRFPSARDEPYLVKIGVQDAALASVASVRTTSRAKRRAVPPGAIRLRFWSFADVGRWYAVVPSPDERKPFHHDGNVGDVVDVEFERRSGLTATVDLLRSPRAARALIVNDDHAMAPGTLDRDGFLTREREAVRAIALPLPDRRKGRANYPLGFVPLDDRGFRIELWSLREPTGERSLITSQSFRVAGDTVELTL